MTSGAAGLVALPALALLIPALAHHEPKSLLTSLRDDGSGGLLIEVRLFGEVTGPAILETIIEAQPFAPGEF